MSKSMLDDLYALDGSDSSTVNLIEEEEKIDILPETEDIIKDSLPPIPPTSLVNESPILEKVKYTNIISLIEGLADSIYIQDDPSALNTELQSGEIVIADLQFELNKLDICSFESEEYSFYGRLYELFPALPFVIPDTKFAVLKGLKGKDMFVNIKMFNVDNYNILKEEILNSLKSCKQPVISLVEEYTYTHPYSKQKCKGFKFRFSLLEISKMLKINNFHGYVTDDYNLVIGV